MTIEIFLGIIHRDRRFNTASGMRSHVTERKPMSPRAGMTFQYRKRYEVTCDLRPGRIDLILEIPFQYRKRYEVTCDSVSGRPQK